MADDASYTENSYDNNLTGGSGGLSTIFGNILSKGAETALEVVKAKNTNTTSPGTVYPTGQTNPAQLQSAAVASPGLSTKQILLIAGGGLLVIGVFAVLLRSANK